MIVTLKICLGLAAVMLGVLYCRRKGMATHHPVLPPESVCDLCGSAPWEVKRSFTHPQKYLPPDVRLCRGCFEEDEALNNTFRSTGKEQ